MKNSTEKTAAEINDQPATRIPRGKILIFVIFLILVAQAFSGSLSIYSFDKLSLNYIISQYQGIQYDGTCILHRVCRHHRPPGRPERSVAESSSGALSINQSKSSCSAANKSPRDIQIWGRLYCEKVSN